MNMYDYSDYYMERLGYLPKVHCPSCHRAAFDLWVAEKEVARLEAEELAVNAKSVKKPKAAKIEE